MKSLLLWDDDISAVSATGFSTQAQILKVFEAMGSLRDESSVQRSSRVVKWRQARRMSDLDPHIMNRIEAVFIRGIKAWARMWARMLVSNWNMKCDC